MRTALKGTPYSDPGDAFRFPERAGRLDRRMELLRSEGTLTEQTLRAYFTDKRFEQIAESNAIEGSPLSVGETELAIMKGVTISGHDPAWSQDAVRLAGALDFMADLARQREPATLTLQNLREIHALVLGDHPQAGKFRTQEVRISGADHQPPASPDVPAHMRAWSDWSAANSDLSGLLRAIVLSTWLTHVHPFLDGNGRTSRAILNLELIRAGYPSIIIRRKDRGRYLEALARSDEAGDLRSISDLILMRAGHALGELERTASREPGFDQAKAQLQQAYRRQAAIWNDATKLLFSLLEDRLQEEFPEQAQTRWYSGELSVSDYIALSRRDASGNSWLFQLELAPPGLPGTRLLAWTRYRSHPMRDWNGLGEGPAICWSGPDTTGREQWSLLEGEAPGPAELTLRLPDADAWIGRWADGRIRRYQPSELVRLITQVAIEAATRGSTD